MPSKKKDKEIVSAELPSHTPSSSLDRWLAIANLVLTAIVGIGIAVFLQLNNQRFAEQQQVSQQNFLATQQSLQQEFQNDQLISNIVKNSYIGGWVNFDTYPIRDIDQLFTSIYEFSNNGPAIANNLNISVCLYKIGPMGTNTINDIDVFEITPTDSSINFEKTETSRECNQKTLRDVSNNTVLFNFKFLSPYQAIRITLKYPNDDILGNEITDTVKTFALIPNTLLETNQNGDAIIFSPIGSSNFIGAMNRYLFYKSSIAMFYAETSCDNCTVRFEGTFYPGGVSTIKNRSISKIESIKQGVFYIKVAFDTKITYSLPEKSTRIFTDSDLYLILYQNGNENKWWYDFETIDKADFETYDINSR